MDKTSAGTLDPADAHADGWQEQQTQEKDDFPGPKFWHWWRLHHEQYQA
jgi:hypothetical protein